MALSNVWTVHFHTMSSSSSPQFAGFVFLRWKPLLNYGSFPSHVRNPFSHVSLSVANILLFCLVTSSLEVSLSVCWALLVSRSNSTLSLAYSRQRGVFLAPRDQLCGLTFDSSLFRRPIHCSALSDLPIHRRMHSYNLLWSRHRPLEAGPLQACKSHPG